jgi:hypothetical protein
MKRWLPVAMSALAASAGVTLKAAPSNAQLQQEKPAAPNGWTYVGDSPLPRGKNVGNVMIEPYLPTIIEAENKCELKYGPWDFVSTMLHPGYDVRLVRPGKFTTPDGKRFYVVTCYDKLQSSTAPDAMRQRAARQPVRNKPLHVLR